MSQPNKEYDAKRGKSSLDSNQNPIPNDDPVLHNQSDTEMKQTPESFRPISKSSSLGTGSKLTRDACTSPLNWDSTGKEFDDYMKKLSHWVWQCHQWHFFYNHASLSLASGNLPVGVNLPASARPTETNRTEASPRSAHPTNPTQPPGVVYRIPRLWKRVAADVIDYFILLIFKVIITLSLSEIVELKTLEEIDVGMLLDSDNPLDDMFDFIYELLALAVMHRIVACIYETVGIYCSPNVPDGAANAGGRTPGKNLMGIKVVSCTSIESTGVGLVRITPAGNLSFTNSFIRSLIKNVFVIFFVPPCLTVIGAPNNRSAYDVMCQCVVVEARPVTP